MKPIPAFLLISFLCVSIGIVEAGEQITLSPDGSHSNQNQINEALKKAGDSGAVTLTSGEYEINGPVYVPRDITIKGEPGAKILVSKDIQNPWFSPTVGVVNCFDPFNIKISGIEIDGNCQNLPSPWASSPGHAHDQEQLIKIIGSSGIFGQNIEISNTVLHNSFGDGIQARFIDGIISKDNEIINTQHESIYYSACKNCKMINNRMAIITSDGGRFDNCVNGEAEGNIVWQYNGTNNNGAYKGGASAFQVGDAGSSKGYNGKKDWIHSTNIELHNNTIIDPGRKAFVVDAAGQTPSTNLYIHDNIVVGTEELEIMGIPVSDDISIENPPSVEMSEKVFSSLFDILDRNFTFKYLNKKTKINASVDITDYNNSYNHHSLVYVNGTDLTSIKYEYNGRSATRYFTIYEGNTTSETTLWEGDLPHKGEALFLEGTFDESKLSVTCYNSKGYQKITNFNVTEVSDDSGIVLNPALWSFVGTLAILGISIFRNLRRVIRW